MQAGSGAPAIPMGHGDDTPETVSRNATYFNEYSFIVAKRHLFRCQVAFLLGWGSERGTNNKPLLAIELREKLGDRLVVGRRSLEPAT